MFVGFIIVTNFKWLEVHPSFSASDAKMTALVLCIKEVSIYHSALGSKIYWAGPDNMLTANLVV